MISIRRWRGYSIIGQRLRGDSGAGVSIRGLRPLLDHRVRGQLLDHRVRGQLLGQQSEMTVFLHACSFFRKTGGQMLLVEDNGQFSEYPACFTWRPTMNARATSTTSTAQPTMCQASDCATKMPHTATSTGSR